MLHIPTNDERVFEIFVYNKVVRALVKENKSHNDFDDHWADLQVQKLIAIDEYEARRIIGERLPESDGFTIEAVRCVTIWSSFNYFFD